MPNIKQIITAHNGRILSKTDPATPPGCNCRVKDACPLGGQCQVKGVVYQATVTRSDSNNKQYYIGMTSTTFTERYYNPPFYFRNEASKNKTTLSQFIWKLKNKGIRHNITWKVITQRNSYSPSTEKCNLCLAEKYCITCHPEMSALNNSNELAATCPHKENSYCVTINLIL